MPPMPMPDGPAGPDHGTSGGGENIGSPPPPVQPTTVGAGPPGVRAGDVRRRARSDRPLRRSRARHLRAHRWDGNSQSASIAGPGAQRPDPARPTPEPDPSPLCARYPRECPPIPPPEANTLFRRRPDCALCASYQPHATRSHPPRRPQQAAWPLASPARYLNAQVKVSMRSFIDPPTAPKQP